MRSSSIFFVLVCSLLFLASVGYAQEQTLLVGNSQEGWSFLKDIENLYFINEGGEPHFSLSETSYLSNNTDMLLRFNDKNFVDESGHYLVDSSSILTISGDHALRGRGSALFDEPNSTLLLKPQGNALFADGQHWQDFTIEFWLKPAYNGNYSVIMQWSGNIFDNAEQRSKQQIFQIALNRGRVLWKFENLFTDGKTIPLSIQLQGREQLHPKKWSHHVLRYSLHTGLLEYLVNDEPQDTAHITQNRQEGPGYHIRLGTSIDGMVTIGYQLNAILDDFRITQQFETKLERGLYSSTPGVLTSRVIDLHEPFTQITEVRVRNDVDDYAHIDYFYKISDEVNYFYNDKGLKDEGLPGAWKPLDVNTLLPANIRGRYIQLRAVLSSQNKRDQTPRLYSIALYFAPQSFSKKPEIVDARAFDSGALLKWLPLFNPNVHGYKIQLSEHSRHDIHQKENPRTWLIDVGKQTYWRLSGLENGRPYYLSILAYGEDSEKAVSSYSDEIYILPQEGSAHVVIQR